MDTPTSSPKPQQLLDTELTTGVMRGIDQLDSLNAGLDPHAIDPIASAPPPEFKKERVFSRKVLFGWAGATLVIWFLVRVIAPIVVESVQSAIVSSIEDEHWGSAAAAVPAPPVPPVPPAPVVAPVPPAGAADAAHEADAAAAAEIAGRAAEDARHRDIVSVRGPFTITIRDGKIKKIVTK